MTFFETVPWSFLKPIQISTLNEFVSYWDDLSRIYLFICPYKSKIELRMVKITSISVKIMIFNNSRGSSPSRSNNHPLRDESNFTIGQIILKNINNYCVKRFAFKIKCRIFLRTAGLLANWARTHSGYSIKTIDKTADALGLWKR